MVLKALHKAKTWLVGNKSLDYNYLFVCLVNMRSVTALPTTSHIYG